MKLKVNSAVFPRIIQVSLEICLRTFEGDQDVTAAEIDEELSAIK